MSDQPRDVAEALRLIKEALFALGAEGDECIQKLVAVEAGLKGAEPASASERLFLAFHQGFAAQDEADDAMPRPAYELGVQVARLNQISRGNSGLNIGPFDAPKVQDALARANRAATAPFPPLPMPRPKG